MPPSKFIVNRIKTFAFQAVDWVRFNNRREWKWQRRSSQRSRTALTLISHRMMVRIAWEAKSSTRHKKRSTHNTKFRFWIDFGSGVAMKSCRRSEHRSYRRPSQSELYLNKKVAFKEKRTTVFFYLHVLRSLIRFNIFPQKSWIK